MVRVNWFIFGYRRLSVSSADVSEVASVFLRHGIASSTDSEGNFILSEQDIERALKLIESRIEYTVSDTLGVRGAIKRIKYKRGLFVGALISAFLLIFLETLVWDIRIDGNENISDIEIIDSLSECGFEIGSNWLFVDRGKIETDLLRANDKISWININRKGTVAYIEVIEEKQYGDESKNEVHNGYANIVATHDCVIEEITVKRGTAEVKAGDVVHAGDILISGVIPLESGGGFCYAEGTVIGRLHQTVSVDVLRSYEKVSERYDTTVEMNLKIFNFPINIFKKYGNSYSGCDIIEDAQVFSLFGKASLPLSLVRRYARVYEYSSAEYTDDELVKVTSAELEAKTLAALENSDLLKIKTTGNYTETGYNMTSELVFLSEIGKTLEFKVE